MKKRPEPALVPADLMPKVPPGPLPPVEEAVRAFATIEKVARRHRLPLLAGPQVGLAFPGFVVARASYRMFAAPSPQPQPGYEHFACPSFTPSSDERKASVVRFPNAVGSGDRYFMVERYAAGRAAMHRLVWEPQPHYVPVEYGDLLPGLVVQDQIALIEGRRPDLEGEEYLLH